MRPAIVGVSRIAVGLVFLLSGLAKLRFFSQFVQSLRSYGWIQEPSKLRKLGFLISSSEVLTGAGLFVFRFAWAASVLGLSLLALFTAAVLAALLRPSRPANCGCMVSRTDDQLGWNVVFRNLGFTFLLLPTVLSLPPAVSGIASAALLITSSVLTDVSRERTGAGISKTDADTPNEA